MAVDFAENIELAMQMLHSKIENHHPIFSRKMKFRRTFVWILLNYLSNIIFIHCDCLLLFLVYCKIGKDVDSRAVLQLTFCARV